MTIIELLTMEYGSRVTLNSIKNRWLTAKAMGEGGRVEFTVWQRVYRARNSTIEYQGKDEAEACRVLVSEA